MRVTVTETRSILAVCTLVASIATAGSLYFSEVMGLYPCDLCWIQRIGMYPLVANRASAFDRGRSRRGVSLLPSGHTVVVLLGWRLWERPV